MVKLLGKRVCPDLRKRLGDRTEISLAVRLILLDYLSCGTRGAFDY